MDIMTNMNIDNKYTKMQSQFYDANAPKMARTDHSEHNSNPNYWDILLGDLSDDIFEDDNNVKALDFAEKANIVQKRIYGPEHKIVGSFRCSATKCVLNLEKKK